MTSTLFKKHASEVHGEDSHDCLIFLALGINWTWYLNVISPGFTPRQSNVQPCRAYQTQISALWEH